MKNQKTPGLYIHTDILRTAMNYFALSCPFFWKTACMPLLSRVGPEYPFFYATAHGLIRVASCLKKHT